MRKSKKTKERRLEDILKKIKSAQKKWGKWKAMTGLINQYNQIKGVK